MTYGAGKIGVDLTISTRRLARLDPVIILLVLTAFTPLAPAGAQTAYSPANGPSSIRPWRYGYFTADFTEAEFGLTFMRPVEFGCSDEDCVANLIDFSVHVSGAARKGQSNLLSKVDFVPGFEVGGTIALVIQRGGGGYNQVYLRGTWAGQERKVQITDVSDSSTTIGELGQATYAAALGFNHAFSNLSVVGISFEGRRELSSPGVQRPLEVCGPGRIETGFRIILCNDRYAGPLPDIWTGQARLDALLRILPLTSNENGLHVAMAAATSVDFTEGREREANVALGPAIVAPEYPGEPMISVIVGMRNVFEGNLGATGQPGAAFYGRRFLIRLAFSVPFKVMAGTT